MQSLARFAAPGASRWEISLLEAAPVDAGAASPNGSAARPWGVMVLDDDAGVRTTMRMMVESLGCVVYEAEEPLTAMEMINAEPVDLLLLDLELPGVHGYEVCKALRAHPPRAHLKIVIVSGSGGAEEITRRWKTAPTIFCPSRCLSINWPRTSSTTCGSRARRTASINWPAT